MERIAIVVAPMGIGEVLDAGFSLAKRHYRQLATVAAWGIVPSYLAIGIAGALGTSHSRASLTALSVILFLLGIVGLTLASIATVVACSRLVRQTEGQETFNPTELYSEAVFRLWPLFLLYLIWGLVAVPLVIVVPLGIFIGVRWSVSYLSVLLEPVGPRESLRRSWNLTRGSWWHTAMVFLAGSLLTAILTYVPMAIFALLGTALSALTGFEPLSGLVTTLGETLSVLVAEPFSVAIFVVLYYELRARSEGFDLSQRVSRLAAIA